MKLIDLLAREMTTWPSLNSCNYCVADSKGQVFFGRNITFQLSEAPEDHETARVAREEWSVSQWGSNHGFPPVGLIVEAYFPSDTVPKWLPTKIMYMSSDTVVYADGDGLREVVSTRKEFEKINVSFRPLRNARDKGVDALCDFITGVAGGNDFHRRFWERAYDKGLRAPE